MNGLFLVDGACLVCHSLCHSELKIYDLCVETDLPPNTEHCEARCPWANLQSKQNVCLLRLAGSVAEGCVWEVHNAIAAWLLVNMWVVVEPRDYYCGMLVYFGVYGTDLLWVLIVTECGLCLQFSRSKKVFQPGLVLPFQFSIFWDILSMSMRG